PPPPPPGGQPPPPPPPGGQPPPPPPPGGQPPPPPPGGQPPPPPGGQPPPPPPPEVSKCTDKDPNCAALKYLCNTQLYYSMMTNACAKTCGRCSDDKELAAGPGAAGTGKQCQDTWPDCPVWKANGFCTNPYYNDEDRKKHCAKTCDKC
ncbi:Protein F01D5.1, partial [Aphelenchoides avenae]